MSTTWTGRAWSCSVRLVVSDPVVLTEATGELTDLLDRVDRVASRFRDDSELSIANRRAGRPTPVSPLLVTLVGAALDAAADTDGAVDPTVGLAVRALGYDRDISEVAGTDSIDPVPPLVSSRRTWRDVRLDRRTGLLTVPAGTALDLGATAKAFIADSAAQQLARHYRTSVLVELGGDLAVAGDRPDGWVVAVAEREGDEGQLVHLRHGGVATSTTTIRAWRRDGEPIHHIVDPATGRSATVVWRTVTVAGPSAWVANVASTAAIVRGDTALMMLEHRGLAARLVAADGTVHTTTGWPTPTGAVHSDVRPTAEAYR